MRRIINIIEGVSGSDAMRFVDYLPNAITNAGFGFYFEEGACWGMALALYEEFDSLEKKPELLLMAEFTHAMVRVNGRMIDSSGYCHFSINPIVAVVSKQEIVSAAYNGGHSPSDVASQQIEAAEMIQNAKELAKNED